MLTPTHRVVYTNYGKDKGLAVGLYGDKEEITQILNRLYNYGACENPPRITSNTFGYILTDEKQFKKSLMGLFLAEEEMNLYRSDRNGLVKENEAEILSDAVINDMQWEDFMIANLDVNPKIFTIDEKYVDAAQYEVSKVPAPEGV
jgi:hypothetical protein